MLLVVTTGLFYYLGNNDYRSKGFFLASLNLALSLLALEYLPFGGFGAIGASVLLYVGVLVYNLLSGHFPGSKSGF